MLKILFEDAVAIMNNETIDSMNGNINIEDLFIYENPNLSEVSELFLVCNELRLLFLGNNYYVAPANYYTHYSMGNWLYSYTKTPVRDYDGYFFINKKDNFIYEEIANEKSYILLKRVLSYIIETKLLSYDTTIDTFYSNSGIDRNNIKTIKDLMNKPLW